MTGASGSTESLVAKAPGHAHASTGHRLAIGLPADTLHLFDDQGLALERRIPDQNQLLPQAA